ncbi:OsmC family protein [Carnobacterium gallinarum]|uniref:OsmC family protein n=1 Tax=Carnobacterium gallinarum TaxID=2749 RepID=UPI00054FEFDC|nr:OsmC family protein [Carnobacterium gallinarum]
MSLEKSLFHTEVINSDGVAGKAYVKNGGLSVTVSSPLSSDTGTNPEELLGLAYSTCLNATVQTILKEQGTINKSTVQINVDLIPEAVGYHFDVQAFVWIEDFSLAESTIIVAAAELRCPISKLLVNSKTVTVQAV